MRGYGQFCPVAKAAEVVAERWTPLVIREMIAGSRRFSEIQRGVPLMSSSLLSRRLRELEQAGIIDRLQGDRPRSTEYVLTEAGRELRPIVELLGVWGQRWITHDLSRDDLDASLLMWDIRRGLDGDRMPEGQTVIHFAFSDGPAGKRNWWLVAKGGDVDLCLTDPGRDVDLHIHSDVRTLVDVWMGHMAIGDALRGGDITVEGPRTLVRAFPQWLRLNVFAEHARPA